MWPIRVKARPVALSSAFPFPVALHLPLRASGRVVRDPFHGETFSDGGDPPVARGRFAATPSRPGFRHLSRLAGAPDRGRNAVSKTLPEAIGRSLT